MKTCIVTYTLKLLTAIILSGSLFVSCKPTLPTTDTKDLSYLYNPIKNPINPRYNITNVSEESSVLSVKFFANDLYFSEANPEGVPTASILINVRLFNINLGKVLADTAIFNLNIIKTEGKQEYVYNVPLNVEKGFEYVAEIKIMDKIRVQSVQYFKSFNTLSPYNRYNFRIQGHFDMNEIYNPVLRVNEYINMVYLREPVDSIFLSYYKPFSEIPDPPSMILPEKTIDYNPEQVVAIPYSDTLPIMLPRAGIYFCSVDREINEGYTLLNMGSSFPEMTTPEEMIEPLAYLASPEELASLISSIRPKAALDDFWIKCGGNIERARELIRIYYTRVLYSNYYFTSYKEGWRSERGMIYVIYGPPDKVYKTIDGETWGYKKPAVKSSWGGRYTTKEEYMFFYFRQRENIFSDNDYYLRRSETPVTYWDQAILSWRKGIVFRLDNPDDI